MATAARVKSNADLLRELAALPEGQAGEVIDGVLHLMGRPGQAHQRAAAEAWGALRFGGPGGDGGAWLFYQGVAVRFPSDEEVVPDLSGWRRERFGDRFQENPITQRPDWVCEVLSDSTRRKDLGPKRRLYAAQGVPYLWLLDPAAHVLEAFALSGSAWQLLGTWSEADQVGGVAPFPELSFSLASWWLSG